jgi:chromosome segregation ATPase
MQEQEREAYVTGHNGMAKLLADVIDSHEAESIEEDRAREQQEEIDELRAQIRDTEEEMSTAKYNMEELEHINAKLTAEIDEMHELIADLRHTIRGDK